MIKTLAVLYLLGATCFSLASPTGGQLTPRQRQALQSQKLQAQQAVWPSTPLRNGNLRANAQPFKSQESENEISDGENAGGVEPAPVTEDKQLPDEPAAPIEQQPQPTSPIPQQTPTVVPVPSKRPPVQLPQPTPPRPYYGQVYPNYNQKPGTPITQYSGIQVQGYQKEQTGQQPISQHQQMFYAGGSNSIPMMIYSDSATPPITMFYLGQGDKQIQAAIPNLPPFNPQIISPSQGMTPFNPMPLQLDSIPSSPMNSWDRQFFPIFDQLSLQQFYPSNNGNLKTKESKKGRIVSFKPKAAEMEMNFESEQISDLMGRAAIMSPSYNVFNPRAADSQYMHPWVMPQNQRIISMDDMRSVVNPFWGKASWNEPMTKASSNEFEVSMLGSRYSSLPTSPYPSGGSGSSYGSSGGQSYGSIGGHSYGSTSPSGSYTSGSSGYSSGSPSSSLYSSKGGQYSSSSPSSSVYSSGSQGSSSYSSPSGYSSYSKPSGSQYSSSSKYPSGSSLYSSGGHGSSGYSSGSYGRNAGIVPGMPMSSSHSAHGGHHTSMNQGGYTQAQMGSGSQNLYNHDKQGTSFVQPLPNGGQVSSFSTFQKGYSGASQGQSSLSNSNKKYETQHGVSEGATSYLSPGSSTYLPGSPHNTGSLGSYGHAGMKGSGLLGAVGPQSSQQNSQDLSGSQTGTQQFGKDTPIIAIIPVVVASDQEYPIVPSKNQQHADSIPSTQGSPTSSGPRNAILGSPNAVLGAQYGYGGLGIGGAEYGSSGVNNQYSNLHNGHIAGQSSGALNNQQYGHENVNTGFVQPLPMGGSVYSNVNSDKGYSGGSFGQGSQSVGVLDQNLNNGGLTTSQGYTGVNGLGAAGVGGLSTGILPGAGLGYGGRLGGLNAGLGLNGGLGVGGGLYG